MVSGCLIVIFMKNKMDKKSALIKAKEFNLKFFKTRLKEIEQEISKLEIDKNRLIGKIEKNTKDIEENK